MASNNKDFYSSDSNLTELSVKMKNNPTVTSEPIEKNVLSYFKTKDLPKIESPELIRTNLCCLNTLLYYAGFMLLDDGADPSNQKEKIAQSGDQEFPDILVHKEMIGSILDLVKIILKHLQENASKDSEIKEIKSELMEKTACIEKFESVVPLWNNSLDDKKKLQKTIEQLEHNIKQKDECIQSWHSKCDEMEKNFEVLEKTNKLLEDELKLQQKKNNTLKARLAVQLPDSQDMDKTSEEFRGLTFQPKETAWEGQKPVQVRQPHLSQGTDQSQIIAKPDFIQTAEEQMVPEQCQADAQTLPTQSSSEACHERKKKKRKKKKIVKSIESSDCVISNHNTPLQDDVAS